MPCAICVNGSGRGKRGGVKTGMENKKEAWKTSTVTVQSVGELEFYVGRAAEEGVPVILQFGNPVCERCPQFSEAIRDLKKEFHFLHAYCNTHEADDLLEEFGVNQVPSLVVAKKHVKTAYLNASLDTLERFVKENCSPVLSLSEDF